MDPIHLGQMPREYGGSCPLMTRAAGRIPRRDRRWNIPQKMNSTSKLVLWQRRLTGC